MCLACLAPTMLATVSATAPSVFPSAAPEAGWLGEPVGGRITWTGCAGFVLEFDGVRICFDPFATNPGPLALLRPARPDASLVRRTFGEVAGIFVGHTHFDHAMDVAPLAKANPGCVVHGSGTTVDICRRQDVPGDQLQEVADGFRTTIGPFTVEAVESRHGTVPILGRIDVIELGGSGLPRTALRWPRGGVFAWRVSVADRTFHVQTSAGIADEPLARQEPVDVLIACLAARRGTPSYFQRLGDRLQPRVIIPCHHDNFLRSLDAPPKPVPQLDWPAFLSDVDALHTAHGTRLVQLPRGTPVAF